LELENGKMGADNEELGGWGKYPKCKKNKEEKSMLIKK
jgi:hypothetical protein